MINVDEHEMKLKYMGDSYYQDSVVVMIKGYEIELSRILTVLSIIDFSRNKFQGEIPKSIGRLNSLRGFNISHNNLTGHIPTSLGNLKNLESLDLSSNKLVGEIPQQLTNLIFLEVLNLSDNQLAGPIPQGSQFNTFGSDSYGGNLALCGLPLSKKCKELLPLPPPPTLQQDENSDKSSGFNWQVVVLGYGCGFLFGMIMGYLMFVTRRPEWLMKIVEGKHHKKVKRSKKGAH
ncbi:receptor-like protein 18 [Camellia sinensis]|uniref:receptor-like protein 18 n=1 Tax=Camellia sinensis TaxID=4442 RepID=UPI00103626F7|nr:receptor-like protein 18 [Camellia sinensis]